MKKYVSWGVFLCSVFLVIFLSVPFAEGLFSWPIGWVEGSRATASWSKYADEDYYMIEIKVWDVDDGTLLGTDQTGTSDTMIDLQQEIHLVIGDSMYDSVDVSFVVKAIKETEEILQVLCTSDESDRKNYHIGGGFVLDPPTGTVKKGVMTLNPVECADYYHVDVIAPKIDGSFDVLMEETIYPDTNGVISWDVSEYMDEHFADYRVPGYELQFNYRAQAFSNNPDLFKPSRQVSIGAGAYSYVEQLASPTGTVTKGGLLSLNPVNHADYYYM